MKVTIKRSKTEIVEEEVEVDFPIYAVFDFSSETSGDSTEAHIKIDQSGLKTTVEEQSGNTWRGEPRKYECTIETIDLTTRLAHYLNTDIGADVRAMPNSAAFDAALAKFKSLLP